MNEGTTVFVYQLVLVSCTRIGLLSQLLKLEGNGNLPNRFERDWLDVPFGLYFHNNSIHEA
jgi:hypothetical protein